MCGIGFAIVIVAACFLQRRINDSSWEDASGTSAGWAENSKELGLLSVDEIYADRLSEQTIQISWPDSLDAEAEQYIVKKRRIHWFVHNRKLSSNATSFNKFIRAYGSVRRNGLLFLNLR